ncbi:MAG: DUF882 domain-containing protein [Bacteroidetes bacterium]|nr:DUF882 domain-containing protein [Bacteroidota bacterium]
MTDNLSLSLHFSLHEFLQSQTATRKQILEQFDPSEEIVDSLKYLCVNLLEKIRELNNNQPIHISSGYRCPRLNDAVGGAPTSQHVKGEAADIDFGSKDANKAFFDKIRDSGLEFDQLINEYAASWVHVSLKQTGNRRQVLNIV